MARNGGAIRAQSHGPKDGLVARVMEGHLVAEIVVVFHPLGFWAQALI